MINEPVIKYLQVHSSSVRVCVCVCVCVHVYMCTCVHVYVSMCVFTVLDVLVVNTFMSFLFLSLQYLNAWCVCVIFYY